MLEYKLRVKVMWRALLSALISFLLDIPIDKALTDWAKATNANWGSLLVTIINTISFLGIFGVLFALFSKIFGGHDSG
jgi:hypothetical protein